MKNYDLKDAYGKQVRLPRHISSPGLDHQSVCSIRCSARGHLPAYSTPATPFATDCLTEVPHSQIANQGSGYCHAALSKASDPDKKKKIEVHLSQGNLI